MKALLSPLLLCLAWLLAAAAGATAAPGAHAPRVLVLHGLSQDHPWVAPFDLALTQALQSVSPTDQLYVEHLDEPRFSAAAMGDGLVGFLSEKYRLQPPDVVVAFGPSAARLAPRIRQAVAPQAPLIAIVSREAIAPEVLAAPRMVQVRNAPTFEQNFRFIRDFLPQARTVVVVGQLPGAQADQVLQANVASIARPLFATVQILPQTRLSEVLPQLAALPSDAVVYLYGFLSDDAGDPLSAPVLGRLVSEAAPVPTFSPYDSVLGSGVAGGFMQSGSLQGQTTAQLLRRLLQGEDMEHLGREVVSPAGFFFDHNALRRFGLENRPLPVGSSVINRPLRLYETNPMAVTVVSGVIATLLVLLGALLVVLRMRRNNELRLTLAANVFTHAREGIIITDAEGQIIDVNDAYTRITGFSRDESLGENPRFFSANEADEATRTPLWESLVRSGQWSGEIWQYNAQGDLYAEMLTASAVRAKDGSVSHYVALFSDVTAAKEHQRQLEHIAHYDALTQMPNRLLLVDRLQQAIVHSKRRGKSLAIAYLDLDGFKEVNDLHGHAIGDRVLVLVGQRMQQALRAGDTLARFGGDEFVAVLVDLEQTSDCEPVLQRVQAAACAPVTLDALELRLSASIGVTLYPLDDAEPEQLIRHADLAMYEAKQSGKNRYRYFDTHQHTQVRHQLHHLQELAQALARSEFVLFYQPKVHLTSGALVGAEALIRWQHPERGLLSPADFLPALEESALEVEVGEWVIATALRQIALWQLDGLVVSVSVNVGARQLQGADFLLRLHAALQAQPDVHARLLELEIVESSALENLGQVRDTMLACCALGVRFALDDFGTGYSSLTYLRNLPAQTLKIDQSFVRGMRDNPDDLAIVHGVLGLAKAFNRSVIAEGVETQELFEQLQSLGCEQAQGYAIARPMPAAQFVDWVAAWQARAV